MTRSLHTNRRRALQLIGSGAAACAMTSMVRAQAKTKVALGYTAVTDYANAFAAREEGYFDKHGLDVEFKLIPLNPSIPAALESDSLQIGGPTVTVFLQAVDGGLDHVLLAGAGAAGKTMARSGIVARADGPIKAPQDFVGRKVGVPGLGALLHVAGRAWLKSQGVDYNKVTFIESSFPQHADLLKGGSVDAVISADPFMARVIGSGLGRPIVDFSTVIPEGAPTLLYVARRDWATKNATAAKGFQSAIAEGSAFVNKPENEARTREHIGRYIKLPPEVMATVRWSPAVATVTQANMNWWVDAMTDQKMLRARPDFSKLAY